MIDEMFETLLKYLNDEIDQDDFDAQVDQMASYQSHLMGEE